MSNSSSLASLTSDFERFKRALPRDFPAHVRDTYRINLAARYLGEPIPHPVGKGSGQLSLNTGQLETDAEAGLAFAVLKTVIAQDSAGDQSMAAWDFTRAGLLLTVPSVKYHLPRLNEPFREAEYAFTTHALAYACGQTPLLLEKDFSPTLAGDPLADEKQQILRWLREVPAKIKAHANVRLAMKLMNARFDDDFQREMMDDASSADALVVFNRLFDANLGVAYRGPELGDRNLRVL